MELRGGSMAPPAPAGEKEQSSGREPAVQDLAVQDLDRAPRVRGWRRDPRVRCGSPLGNGRFEPDAAAKPNHPFTEQDLISRDTLPARQNHFIRLKGY